MKTPHGIGKTTEPSFGWHNIQLWRTFLCRQDISEPFTTAKWPASGLTHWTKAQMPAQRCLTLVRYPSDTSSSWMPLLNGTGGSAHDCQAWVYVSGATKHLQHPQLVGRLGTKAVRKRKIPVLEVGMYLTKNQLLKSAASSSQTKISTLFISCCVFLSFQNKVLYIFETFFHSQQRKSEGTQGT